MSAPGSDASLELQRRLQRSAVWDDVAGGLYAVLGLGRSGVAAANALARRGAEVIAWDDAPADQLRARLDQLDPRVQARCGASYAARPGEIAVLSPGIGPTTPTWKRVHASAAAVIGEVELFYRLDRAANQGAGHPILAITGTDGKTTTACMLAALCESAGYETLLAGNIGEPLCDHVDKLGPRAVVVAEVSAFQLITSPLFRPRVAVLTNIAADHLDYFDHDFDAYIAAKVALAQNCGPGDTVVVNGHDRRFATLRERLVRSTPTGPTVLPFSARAELPAGATLRDGHLQLVAGGGTWDLAATTELGVDGPQPWGGVHNHDNALAASAAAFAFGVPLAAIRRGLRTFAPPRHRCEPVGRIGEVRFVNDSKATNPHAAMAGLRGTSKAEGERLVWIGGGSEKDSDFGELAVVIRDHADEVVLTGATAHRIAAALADLPDAPPVHHVPDLHAAVPRAWQLAGARGVVLLSPACASFDAFKSYAHRGDTFRDAVARLAQATGAAPLTGEQPTHTS